MCVLTREKHIVMLQFVAREFVWEPCNSFERMSLIAGKSVSALIHLLTKQAFK